MTTVLVGWAARRAGRGRRGIAARPAAFVVAALAAVASACSSTSGVAESKGHSVPESGPEVVVVSMSEYRFDFDRPIPAGRVIFVVRNVGREDHKLTLVPLPEDFPPLDAQLHGSERRVLAPYAGVPDRRPDQDGAFAVDLVEGRRYGMICNLSTPSGGVHALEGMNAEFRAGTASNVKDPK
ncbi:MAG: hypothetical protein CYG61_00380 [Actinobacteria bacterium]|nr:MAG: hypothetical protein CYG61_00380 [Actinomycetota bacterium]